MQISLANTEELRLLGSEEEKKEEEEVREMTMKRKKRMVSI